MPVLDGIDELEDNSLNCIVTSPPYWGLRDYGNNTVTIWGGIDDCEHFWGNEIQKFCQIYININLRE